MELFTGLRGEGLDTPDAGARPRRVLVVDDNENAADVLSVILRLWGHEARVVYDGFEAIAAARQYVPDVILLDISLPGMDGYAVARALRRDVGFRDTPILALTGHDRDEDRRLAAEAGFDRHLNKPLDLDRLERILAELAEPVESST